MAGEMTIDRRLHRHEEDRNLAEACEKAYRRGYHQALDEAVTILDRNGWDRPRFWRWLKDVADWRNRVGRHERPILPPKAPPSIGP